MKKELLDILKCPGCGGALSLKEVQRESPETGEIREGGLSCGKCGARYRIKDGIVNLLLNPPRSITEQVRVVYEADRDAGSEGGGFDLNPETLMKYKKQYLSLPEGDGSELYSRGAFRNIALCAKRYNAFFSRLQLAGGERVLELGADSCWSVNRFALAGCSCVALDINHHLVISDLFMSENRVYFERAVADMDNLPFRNGVFDMVFCSAALHHSPDVKHTLSEAYRVLKPGGRVALFYEPALGELMSWYKLFFGRDAKRMGIYESIFTLREWLGMFRRSGFETEVYFSFQDIFSVRHGKLKALTAPFRNEFVKRILLKSFFYPLFLLRPYKADFILTKPGGNEPARRKICTEIMEY